MKKTYEAKGYILEDGLLEPKFFNTYEAFIKYLNENYYLDECYISIETREDNIEIYHLR